MLIRENTIDMPLFMLHHKAVIVGDDKHSKNELEVMIKSHGGNYYQDESAVENIHVIAGQMSK